MSMVIDPQGAQNEVVAPVVAWNDDEPVGHETWHGKITGSDNWPQVTLKRRDDDGTSVTVRVSILSHIELKKGVSAAGVAISLNGIWDLDWRSWYTMLAAVQEAVDRLTEMQGKTLGELGDRLMGGAEGA